MQLMSKTAGAFTFSAEKLFNEYAQIYFWTFTFVTTPIDDATAMEDWNMLHGRIKREFKGIKGLRVCELHRSHGIHFHVFVNVRIPIRRMKQIFRGTGYINGKNRRLDFGRVSVAECNRDTIAYMCKYLTKEYRQAYSFKHRRRWGTVGGFKPVRVRDVIFECDATRNREAIFGKAKCKFATFIMIQHYTALWGKVKDWPFEHRALVMRLSMENNGEWMQHQN